MILREAKTDLDQLEFDDAENHYFSGYSREVCHAIYLEGLGWWNVKQGWCKSFNKAMLYQNQYRARQHCRKLLRDGWIDDIDKVMIITYKLLPVTTISGEKCLERGNDDNHKANS